jgi:hypothetical protein
VSFLELISPPRYTKAIHSQDNWRGYRSKERRTYYDVVEITGQEQDIIWSRNGKPPDFLVCLGDHFPGYEKSAEKPLFPWLHDYRVSNNEGLVQKTVDSQLVSLFYIELIGLPQLNEVGFFCRAQVRCRLLPSTRAYQILVDRLRKERARLYYDYQSTPCVTSQLFDEASRGIAFSRCIEFSVLSMDDDVDIKIDGITSGGMKSISNCPYRLRRIIEDQGLDCVFGHRDHKRRYLGLSRELPRTQWYI